MSRSHGVVVRFDSRRGYGFITITSGPNEGEQAFAHQNDINMEGFRFLKQDEEVAFDLEQNEQGLKAIDIDVLSNRPPPRRPVQRTRNYNNDHFRPSGRPQQNAEKARNARINRLEKIIGRLVDVLADEGGEDEDIDPILTRDDIDFIMKGDAGEAEEEQIEETATSEA